MTMAERVNHPAHYNAGGIECIDALEAATIGLEGIEAFCTANAIKYLWRWKRKNGEEDLQKAIWYINRIIDRAGEPPEERKGLFNMTENKHGFMPKQEITIGGIAFTIIQTAESWVKCIASECIGNGAFDTKNRNDFAASDIREFLNGEFLQKLIGAGAPEAMFEYFNVDLTADDGLKDYGGDCVRVGLITCDEYRLLRGNIPELPDTWWWTATPDSPKNSLVRYVYSDGTLNYYNAYYGNYGVRPLRWKMRSSRHKPKAEYHHQRKVYPAAAIHSGGQIQDRRCRSIPRGGRQRLHTARNFYDRLREDI